jgi:hypothetical protein
MRFTLLLLALLLASCNAQQPLPAKTSEDIQAIVQLANATISLIQKVNAGASDDDVQALLRKTIEAARVAESHIKSGPTLARLARSRGAGRLEVSAVGNVSACATTHTIEILSLESMSETIRQQWASEAPRCAMLATELLRTVSNNEAADEMGYTLGVLYPLAIAARAISGFDNSLLLERYRYANQAIIARLAPACHEWKIATAPQTFDVHYTCVALDGRQAQGKESYKNGRLTTAPMDRTLIDAEATRLTSRAVALAVLPRLARLPPD